MRDWRTDPDVARLGERVDRAMKAGFAAHDIFADSDNSREFNLAYEAWMRGRAAAGDPFAASLGFRDRK